MATLTTGVVLLRWQLLSAVMMFWPAHSTSVFVGLIMSACGDRQAVWALFPPVGSRWGLFGITMADITAIWHNIESVMIEEMNQTPPQWPMILT
ncbi:YjcB family protein [Escherichia coli]